MFEQISIINLAFAALVLWAIYVTVEGLKHVGFLKGEYGRKAIHISTGILLAALPTFMVRTEIAVFNALFFLGLIGASLLARFIAHDGAIPKKYGGLLFSPVRKMLRSMRSYEDVGRWSIGQFLFPLSVLLVTFMFEDPIVYSFAVLELALADGFAAVFGQKYGVKRYYIPGGYKTWVGSSVFFAVSITLLTTYVLITGTMDLETAMLIIGGAIALTFAEGIISAGFDNMVIPIIMALVLQTLD